MGHLATSVYTTDLLGRWHCNKKIWFLGSTLSLLLSTKYFQLSLGVNHPCCKIWKTHSKQCKGNFARRIKLLIKAV